MNRLKASFILLILPLFVFACSSTREIRQPPHFGVVKTTLAEGIDDKGTAGVPLNLTTTFSTLDSEIISHVELRNLSGKHNLRWEWYDSNGNLYYATENYPIETSKEKYVEQVTASHKISLKSERAQEYPGNWKVNIYLDDAVIASNAFEVTRGHSCDVDVNIPKTNTQNPNAIAVVIGNRNYQHKDVPPVCMHTVMRR